MLAFQACSAGEGGKEEGICQNSINTYMDSAPDASAPSKENFPEARWAEGESKQGCSTSPGFMQRPAKQQWYTALEEKDTAEW